MKILILKYGAAGDVVRTSSLLHLWPNDEIFWLTSSANQALLDRNKVRVFTEVMALPDVQFELVVALEDDAVLIHAIYSQIHYKEAFGAIPMPDGKISYTSNGASWFDMSLISKYGLKRADQLKLINRRSYQDHIFSGLGFTFAGEEYVLPLQIPASPLGGDVAIGAEAGDRWPIKRWAYYAELKSELETLGYKVNFLPQRSTLMEHVADIAAHRVVVSNDSLPMHIALGLKKPSVAFFTCTPPWEIEDYGRMTKVVSPLLEKYFYSRESIREGVMAIPFAVGLEATLHKLKNSTVR